MVGRLTSTHAFQVKGGGIGPGRGAKIYAQVAGIFPAGTLSKDDIRNAYNEVCMSFHTLMPSLMLPGRSRMEQGWHVPEQQGSGS